MVDVTQDDIARADDWMASNSWGMTLDDRIINLAKRFAHCREAEAARTERHRNDMADKIVDQRTEIAALKAATRTLPKGSVEKVALAILNSDRAAYGHGMIDSRFKVSDSDGYVVNAQAALSALGLKEE